MAGSRGFDPWRGKDHFSGGSNDAVGLPRSDSIKETVKVMVAVIRNNGAIPRWLLPPQITSEQAAAVWQDSLTRYIWENETLLDP